VSSTSGTRGRYVWLRKQQNLLRIVRRLATADPAYYAARRQRLDRQFAHLHRAVAIPLLLSRGAPARERDLARARGAISDEPGGTAGAFQHSG
jgi:hypothetical protein